MTITQGIILALWIVAVVALGAKGQQRVAAAMLFVGLPALMLGFILGE
jgi:hypothetical protein